MKDFIYNIRRFFLHSKRRYRPGAKNFWLNFRKDPVFRIIVILVFLLAAAIITFILLLTVFPDNPVKAYFSKEELKEVSYSSSPDKSTPTIDPSETLSPTPSPTPDPNEITPTPLATQEEKATVTGWITAPSGLIVRTGPSSQTSKLGTLAYGTKIEIIKEGTWHFIEYEGGGGYVHTNYVFIGDSPPGISSKNTNTSQTWTHLDNSADILVEKIFYNGVTYYVAQVTADASSIFTEYSSLENKLPSEFLQDKDYSLAINGDFFNFDKDGMIIRNGKIVRDKSYSEIAVLYDDGRLEVYFEDEIDINTAIENGALHSWSFGPILVKGGIAYNNFTERTDIDGANPRTGIGVITPGKYIIIVADGRQENSKGFTLSEFAKIFEDYGCKNAYSLNVGGTCVMLFEGEVISSPSGGSEKETSDIIYIS